MRDLTFDLQPIRPEIVRELRRRKKGQWRLVSRRQHRLYSAQSSLQDKHLGVVKRFQGQEDVLWVNQTVTTPLPTHWTPRACLLIAVETACMRRTK